MTDINYKECYEEEARANKLLGDFMEDAELSWREGYTAWTTLNKKYDKLYDEYSIISNLVFYTDINSDKTKFLIEVEIKDFEIISAEIKE